MVGSPESSGDPPPWHLTESPFFWYLIEWNGLDPRDWDEAIDAIKWAIARNPEYYPASDDERVRIAYVPPHWSLPAAFLYYTIHTDEKTCRLEWFQLLA